MESKNRNVLIAAIVFFLVACCCVLVAAGVITYSYVTRYGDWSPSLLNPESGAPNEWTIPVGDAPVIDVSNFAGPISIRAGESNSVYVHAVKRAPNQNRRNQIRLKVTKQDSGVTITAKLSPNTSNSSVNMEITVPPDSVLKVQSGAGTIDVQGIHGAQELMSGAGTIVIKDAEGSIQAQLGAGEITYEGDPAGDCTFHTGAGNITLQMPSDANMRVELGSGIGAVRTDFDVDGQVSPRSIKGVVGNGNNGMIEAHTGAGSVTLTSSHR